MKEGRIKSYTMGIRSEVLCELLRCKIIAAGGKSLMAPVVLLAGIYAVHKEPEANGIFCIHCHLERPELLESEPPDSSRK